MEPSQLSGMGTQSSQVGVGPRGPRLSRVKPQSVGMSFQMISEHTAEQSWQVHMESTWIRFKASAGSVPGSHKVYMALHMPVVFHEKSEQTGSFELWEPLSDELSPLSTRTGPTVPYESSKSFPVQEWPMHFKANGYMPGDQEARHITLLNLEYMGQLTDLEGRCKRLLESLKEEAGKTELTLFPVRSQDLTVHQEWDIEVAILGVKPDCEFVRQIIQPIQPEMFMATQTMVTAGTGVISQLKLPEMHLTFHRVAQ